MDGAGKTTIRAVIFDFDETMIDLEPQHAIADAILCRSMGNDYMELPEEYRKGSGRRVIDDIREMRDRFGWTRPIEELEGARREAFDEACRSSALSLLPGVERSVRALLERGLTLAVTSSAVRGSIEEILRRFELLDAFALIVDGSEVERPKPDPEPYLLTARKLGVSPAECLVFEDSTVGVASAKSAGMKCIAVRNPMAKTAQDLSEADEVLDSFEQFDPASVGGRPERRSS
ncbi:MAG TPA: HAD family phosphatase [Thermoanaerobaculia bacterium]|nr:HAD family phosphatase [Thermoanaerobaculia bacterium]